MKKKMYGIHGFLAAEPHLGANPSRSPKPSRTLGVHDPLEMKVEREASCAEPAVQGIIYYTVEPTSA